MSKSPRVLLLGSAGQVGEACRRRVPAGVELRAATRADLDIADADRVNAFIADFQPDLIINAAAYTAVDKAQTEPEAAQRGNVDGPRNLAKAMARNPFGRMIHLSTDFVFDGAASSPYPPEAQTRPLGVYGATKLAGELAVLEALGERAVILRTSWVYSAVGNNFVRTMLRLMGHGDVRVIADQAGSPTAAHSVAEVVWKIAATDAGGIYHWSDAGIASWYDFAVAIAEEGAACGLLTGTVAVEPIATSDYPTSARRPAYSVLDKSATIRKFGLVPVHWRKRLRAVIEELQRG